MLKRLFLVAAVALHLAAPVHAATIQFDHAYNETVDRRGIGVYIEDSSNNTFRCLAEVANARDGSNFTLTARVWAKDVVNPRNCPYQSGARFGFDLGELAAGTYQVTVQIRSYDNAITHQWIRPLQVLPLHGRCNRDPALTPSISGVPMNQEVKQFMARVATDAPFAASIGNPILKFKDDWGEYVEFTYPPLEDIPPALERLLTVVPEFSASRYYRGQCSAKPPSDVVVSVVEYLHAGFDRYFYTGNAGEGAAIDAGKVGPGWNRTGRSFDAVSEPGCPFAHDQTVVYRFNGIPGVGPDSHFFTRDRAECYVVDKSAKWSLEGLPFWASAPNADGTCDPLPNVGPRVPLYRAWRPFGDSNHRFSTDRAVIDEMVARGWVDEGAVMCVL